MLISHSHKFITVDIPKTGTCSRRLALEPLNIVDIIGAPQATEKNPFEQHASIQSAKQEFIKNQWPWRDYYKWIMCRNPWKRYFSFLNYFKGYREKFLRRDQAIIWGKVQTNQGQICVDLFKNRSDSKVLKILIKTHESQDYFYLDKDGEIIVDYIADFENFSNEWNDFFNKINIDPPKIKYANQSNSFVDYLDVYSQELIDLVAEKEKHIIDLKKYDFK